jgi:hypothetical protein
MRRSRGEWQGNSTGSIYGTDPGKRAVNYFSFQGSSANPRGGRGTQEERTHSSSESGLILTTSKRMVLSPVLVLWGMPGKSLKISRLLPRLRFGARNAKEKAPAQKRSEVLSEFRLGRQPGRLRSWLPSRGEGAGGRRALLKQKPVFLSLTRTPPSPSSGSSIVRSPDCRAGCLFARAGRPIAGSLAGAEPLGGHSVCSQCP